MIYFSEIYGLCLKLADRGLFMEVRFVHPDFTSRYVSVGGRSVCVLTVGKASTKKIA